MQRLGEESVEFSEFAYMPRNPSTFRQTDLTRAIKAARNAGVGVTRAEIAKDGKIVIIIGEAGGANADVELTPDDELDGQRNTTERHSCRSRHAG